MAKKSDASRPTAKEIKAVSAPAPARRSTKRMGARRLSRPPETVASSRPTQKLARGTPEGAEESPGRYSIVVNKKPRKGPPG